MIEKDSLCLYILCTCLIITPIYFVWSKFPDIVSECDAKAEEQIANITLLGSIPLISVIVYIITECVKKHFSKYF